ncbi:MAG: hypothetical protein L0H96_19915 [Humibacillus sp.]|nr:hypothetical protein [Humibacillus sp.]MDN5779164.1 hypothetical protein [Humibacillus sp.]
MSTDVEEFVRHVFADSEIPTREVDPGDVVAIGRRVRRIRRRRATFAGVAATGLIGFGVAQAVVPASGTPLTPLVWAAGEGKPGSEAGAWVAANGHRFVISIRDAYFGDRNAFVLSALYPDGSERVLMAGGPIRPEDLPEVGFAVSTEPGVTFALFAAGSHDFQATDEETSHALSISTMKISSPHGGPDYVAVAMDSGRRVGGWLHPSVTWIDGQGHAQSWGWPR